MLIGTSDIAGKYSFLFNDTNGMVTYVVNELINLIEHKNSEGNKQDIKSRLKISFLLHINDVIYDLVEQNYEKCKKDKYCFIELKSIDEYLNLIPKMLSARKKISNSLGKEEDHNDLVIKLSIENSDGSIGSLYISDLASVEYGLYEKGEEGIFNRYVYENFNTIANKLVKVCNPKYNNFDENNFCKSINEGISNISSKIIMCSYIVSNLYPNKNNTKCLNFISWLKNNIIEKEEKNIYNTNSNQFENYNENEVDNFDSNKKHVLNKNNFNITDCNNNDNQYIDLNYNYGEFDYSSDQNQKSNPNDSFSKNPKLFDNNNKYENNEELKDVDFDTKNKLVDHKIEKLKNQKEKLKQKLNNDGNKKTIISNDSHKENPKTKNKYNNENNGKETKKVTINSTLLNTLDQSNNEELNILKFKFDQIVQENLMLRNENIILREDVTRLTEIGSNFENNMEILKNRQ